MSFDRGPDEGRLQIPLRRQLLYAALLTLCGLGVVELASRLMVAAVPNARWRHHADLVVAIGFGGLNEILEPDPVRFWRLKPSLPPTRLSGRIARSAPVSFTVSTDEEGYRRTPEVPDARSVVLFLGDSCTFGVGVDDDQAFPALLQRRLPAVQARNAGVPGYSALQGRLLLEGRSSLRPPDVIVVSFLFNDDARWDDRSDLEIARALASPLARLARHSRFVSIVSALRREGARPADTPSRPRLTDAEYAEQLRGIAVQCRAPSCRIVFLAWPLRRQMPAGSPVGKQLVMAEVAREIGAPFVDLLPVFQAEGGSGLFADVVHANAAGNRLVADRLEPVLRRGIGARQRS